nr:uncharacterized protein zgc:193593 [Nothobranchius furzeri]
MFFRIPRLTPGYIRYLQVSKMFLDGICLIVHLRPDLEIPPEPLLVWVKARHCGEDDTRGVGYSGSLGDDNDDPCPLFQTQAAQTMLQNHEGSAMPRVAILLGLMGVAMSGYSSRQLTLHHEPSGRLFK